MVKLYNNDSKFYEVYYPSPISGVQEIARTSSTGYHYPIIRQDTKYMLWGFNDGPSNMTTTGKNVFINVFKEHLKLFILIPRVIVTLNP
jgi:hypothetical protein